MIERIDNLINNRLLMLVENSVNSRHERNKILKITTFIFTLVVIGLIALVVDKYIISLLCVMSSLILSVVSIYLDIVYSIYKDIENVSDEGRHKLIDRLKNNR